MFKFGVQSSVQTEARQNYYYPLHFHRVASSSSPSPLTDISGWLVCGGWIPDRLLLLLLLFFLDGRRRATINCIHFCITPALRPFVRSYVALKYQSIHPSIIRTLSPYPSRLQNTPQVFARIPNDGDQDDVKLESLAPSSSCSSSHPISSRPR